MNYYKGLLRSEISQPDGVKRDAGRMDLLLRSYSRNCSTQAKISVFREDMMANDGGTLNDNTVSSYLKVLKGLYVIEESVCWSPNLRSRTAIRTSDTHYFVDPSIACAGLDKGPEALIGDLSLFGLLFENLAVRDVRVYCDAPDCTVKHYRDASGLEVDAILDFRDGSWAAAEVKLGSEELIEEGANNLLDLAERVDTEHGEPKFLMVITATAVAYRRGDGVLVVPLGCLGP